MKKTVLFLAALSVAALSQAALKPGDSLTPYTIHNVATGQEYCQVCAYGAKTAKAVAFGKLKDASFWADLQKLQALQTANPNLGVFAQVIDSKDADAIKAEAGRQRNHLPRRHCGREKLGQGLQSQGRQPHDLLRPAEK